MQALKKAEQNKQGGENTPPDAVSTSTLTLESLQDEAPANPAYTDNYRSAGRDPKSSPAANLFAAKQHKRISPFAIVAGIGVLILAGWGAYLYYQLITPPPFVPASHVAEAAKVATDTKIAEAHIAPQAETSPPAAQTEVATNNLHDTSQSNAETYQPVAKPDRQETRQPYETKIQFKRETAPTVISPTLTNAYQALKENHLDSAQTQYQRLLSAEPNNIDALLGLAAISAKQGKNDQSAKYLMRVLELDPKNAAAQAGLISFMGKSDPSASEMRLKQLIQNQPAAFLFFNLGNLYASQSQWAAAEQAYFQAYQMELGNPDYAYNLAVSLEHLQQSRQALAYYQQALRLIQKSGYANFDKTLLQTRINQLTTAEPTGSPK